MRGGLAIFLALVCGLAQAEDSVYISRAELMLLPMSGAAWNNVLSASSNSVAGLNLSDQNNNQGIYVLAKALVGVRTNNEVLLAQVRAACLNARETENGGRALALGRELCAVVIAADLAVLSPGDKANFSTWLAGVIRENLDGRTLISTHADRPNNWGTMAGASLAAAYVYLGDGVGLARTAVVFKGFLGDRTAYAGFKYGDLDWQADPSKPVGINPLGAVRSGFDVDGIIPDDMRRGGGLHFPPSDTGYPWESLQGIAVQAEILHRQGFDTFAWQDMAVFRAVDRLHQSDIGWPAEGDDEWTPHLINFRYGTNFPARTPARHGKILGFTDWTHGPGRSPDPIPDPGPGPTPSILVVTPTSLTFAHTIGQPTPTPKTAQVTSSGSTVLTFATSSNQPWAIAGPASGSTPATVTVQINPTGLAAGSHSATIAIGAKSLDVALTVSATVPDPEPDPDPGPSATLDVRVAAGSDDAEERKSGSISLNDGDTNLINETENKNAGTRFNNLGIPRGATIKNAYVEFVANEAHSGACALTIHAHKVGHAPTFTTAVKFNISARPKTTAVANWSPPAWTVGSLQRTSDLSPVVQEIVARSDWSPGNSLALIFGGTGKRVAENFNKPAKAAILHVEY